MLKLWRANKDRFGENKKRFIEDRNDELNSSLFFYSLSILIRYADDIAQRSE